MRILLLCHAFNSLTQRLFVALREAGHWVSVEFDINDQVTMEAAHLAAPDLIIAPFLKRRIPAEVWQRIPCLIVHPGPLGDGGPSALDWALSEGHQRWGVTILQAEEALDGGPVWESRSFPRRPATKSSHYRHEVGDLALAALLDCVARFPEARAQRPAQTHWRPALKQAQRAIDWAQESTEQILRKIRAADGFPGVWDDTLGAGFFLFDAHPAPTLSGDSSHAPGTLLGRCQGAIARATLDGALWIGHLKAGGADAIKLPAVQALGPLADTLPSLSGFSDLWYEERQGVGFLHFPFYNGAMNSEQCQRLRQAYLEACQRDTKVLVLMGGPDYWSNGIHLNCIEAADSPADESWRNINAMNDLAQAIITTGSHLTIAALEGNAGAGGVFLALACDLVVARDGIILNPHYKGMGNLYGSEYWTYLLPRRAGAEQAARVTEGRLPMGVREAKALGLIDEILAADGLSFHRQLADLAESLAADAGLGYRLSEKRLARQADEADKPLAAYREEELQRMKLNFYGFDSSYHVARYHFVHKLPKSRTPPHLALHRHRGRSPS